MVGGRFPHAIILKGAGLASVELIPEDSGELSLDVVDQGWPVNEP
jgi:hypothetical protein